MDGVFLLGRREGIGTDDQLPAPVHDVQLRYSTSEVPARARSRAALALTIRVGRLGSLPASVS